jgi:hypothetical protein
MLEKNIYKEICNLFKTKSVELSDKLIQKLKNNDDPLKVLEYIQKITNTIKSNINQKTVTVRLIPEITKQIEKTCTRKIFRGGASVGIPFATIASGDNINRISSVGEEIMYSEVDFENGIARKGIEMTGGGDRYSYELNEALGPMLGGGKLLLIQLIGKMITKNLKEKNIKIEKNAKRMISSYIYYKILCNINKSNKEKKLLKFL